MWGPGHAFALALVVVLGHALHTPRPRPTVVLVAFWRRGRIARGRGTRIRTVRCCHGPILPVHRSER